MYDISLVVPTYGRFEELRQLLESITKQDYNLSKIEIIIIDQNDIIDLTPIICGFKITLDIKHIKTDRKGIAHSKNLGLRVASADIISFPDDDCKYYEDTVSSVIKKFNENHYDIVYGRIYDRGNRKNIMRDWPDKEKKLNKINFHLRYSAVTCFTRLKGLYFYEMFGVGTQWGVGEELDYIMRALKNKAIIYFIPTIDLWHPELNVSVMTKEKVLYYAKGWGATFRKNKDPQFMWIFLMSLGYQLISFILELCKNRKDIAYKRWIAFKGRIIGFAQFDDDVSL